MCVCIFWHKTQDGTVTVEVLFIGEVCHRLVYTVRLLRPSGLYVLYVCVNVCVQLCLPLTERRV